MPIHLPSPNRRQFLTAAGAGWLFFSGRAFGAQAASVDEDLVYLLNDTHIGEKHPVDAAVPSHLRQVVDQLVHLERKPACVLINGDLALHEGLPGDYRHLARIIAPLREAGIDLHLTLGNHDHREAFYDVLTEERAKPAVMESRHVAVVETRFANLFLLDSLHQTLITQGVVGIEQLRWLARGLDQRPDKPAIVVAHHNPRLGGDPRHFPGGLIDSRQLWELLVARRQVKAYVHGHIHDRSYAEYRGIHILNTPATSYVADPTKSTTGWTTARLTASGVTLTTMTTDPAHPWNGESVSLAWRNDHV